MEKLTIEVPSDQLIIKDAKCPRGHSLMNPEVKFGEEPGISARIGDKDLSGNIHFCPCYGEFEVRADIPLEDGKIYELTCPKCETSLTLPEEVCTFCGAPIFSFSLPSGGHINACTRKGCHNHKLELIDLEAQLASIFSGELKPRY
jgi:hypothetical protein